MKYKAVIFDFDGVLIDTEGIKFSTWQKIARQYGKKINKQFFVKECCGKSGAAVGEILSKKYAISLNPEKFAKIMRLTSIPMLKSDIRPIKENINLLAGSHTCFKGNIGLASSQEKDILMYSLKRLGIVRYFKKIIAGHEVKNMKPAPDVYLAICEKLKVKPSNCIVIEDSQAGVESAYNAGICLIIAMPREFTKSQDFSKANVIVDDKLRKFNSKQKVLRSLSLNKLLELIN